MGYRTTLVINNDHLDRLDGDENITTKIKQAINAFSVPCKDCSFGILGSVVEQAHADVAKLVIIGKNGMLDIVELATTTSTARNSEDNSVEIQLLTEAANKLGYRLVKR